VVGAETFRAKSSWKEVCECRRSGSVIRSCLGVSRLFTASSSWNEVCLWYTATVMCYSTKSTACTSTVTWSSHSYWFIISPWRSTCCVVRCSSFVGLHHLRRFVSRISSNVLIEQRHKYLAECNTAQTHPTVSSVLSHSTSTHTIADEYDVEARLHRACRLPHRLVWVRHGIRTRNTGRQHDLHFEIGGWCSRAVRDPQDGRTRVDGPRGEVWILTPHNEWRQTHHHFECKLLIFRYRTIEKDTFVCI